MNRDDEYRRQAAEAEKQARSAISELERDEWLRIAQGWRGLLRKRPRSDETPIQVQAKGRLSWRPLSVASARAAPRSSAPALALMIPQGSQDAYGKQRVEPSDVSCRIRRD